MKSTSIALIATVILLSPVASFADPDKDESGHGKRRHGHREFKEEYWEGDCKVKRKLEQSGEYKEERKCKAREHGHRERPSGRGYYSSGPAYAPVPQPAPVYVPVPAAEPGVVIQGTVRAR